MYSKSNLSAWDSWDSLVYFAEAAPSNYEAGAENTRPDNMQSFTVSVWRYGLIFEGLQFFRINLIILIFWFTCQYVSFLQMH